MTGSPSSVLLIGFGPTGSVSLVITLGYGTELGMQKSGRLEYTVPNNRLEYTVPDARQKYTVTE